LSAGAARAHSGRAEPSLFGEACFIRVFALFLLSLAPAAISSVSGEVVDARILFTDSTFISCQCPRAQVRCDDLARATNRQRRVPAFVRNFLDSLGFFHARWDTVSQKRYQVTPGLRAVIASEKISGADSIRLDSLMPREFPRRYDAGEIGKRVAQIARRCAEKGYPFATIAVAIAPPSTAPSIQAEPDSLTVTYRVNSDRKCLFAAPRLIGARSTKSKLLLRDVVVQKGSVFDVRKIEETVERLNLRAYIAAASVGAMAVEPETMRENDDRADDQTADYVAAPILVKDRTGLGIEGALGFNSAGGDAPVLQGDLTLSFLNIFHSGESASLLYAGDKTYQKFHVEGSKPWLLGRPFTATASFGLEIHEHSYAFLNGEATLLAEIQRNWHAGISLQGSETTTDSVVDSSSSATRRYYGADFLLSRLNERLMDGIVSRELSLATGGGISNRERAYTRSHIDFVVGIHLPLWRHQALHLRFISKYLQTDEATLVAAEMYRVGGYRSVRGYADDEFAFRTVAYNQLEYLFYFNPTGSTFIFMDSGLGFERSLNLARWSERREFLGYGLGVRVPAKLGTLTLEWARNIDDTKSLGRVHVMVQNQMSSGKD
jgi:outer membrane protein assembly factor BamA